MPTQRVDNPMAGSLLETPSSSHPSLTTLPKEILTSIASYLDRAGALALIYTSKCFAQVCEKPLWRDLDLSINPFYGELPLILKHPVGSTRYEDAYRVAGEEADERYSVALRDKVKGMLYAGDGRRWKMAESVRIVNRPDAVHSLIQVLDCAAPSLQSLKLEAAPQLIAERHREYRDHQQLEFLMIGPNLSFPSLIYIHIGPEAVRYVDFLSLICNAAPNLEILIVETITGADADARMDGYFHTYERNTKLKRLRLSVETAAEQIIGLLDRSPELEQLHVTGNPKFMEHVLDSLNDCANLRDLCCPLNLECFYIPDSYEARQTSLRTVVLDHEGDHDPYLYMPRIPLLQHIYLNIPADCPLNHVPPAYPSPVLEAHAHPSPMPFIGRGLLSAPELCTIHTIHIDRDSALHHNIFTDLASSALDSQLVGVFRSIRHNGAELLHARLLLSYQDLAYAPYSHRNRPELNPPLYEHMYVAADNSVRVKIHRRRARPTWRDFTDFNGLVVPLETIDQMLEVEGISDEEWMGRGMEVGDEAWKVLTDWEAEERAAAL